MAKVLVVADAAQLQRIVHQMLTPYGHWDDRATSDAALEMLGATKYDVVIADWDNATLTGLQLLEKIKAEPSYGNPLVILMSGTGNRARAKEAETAGAKFLEKPFSKETLDGLLKAAVGR